MWLEGVDIDSCCLYGLHRAVSGGCCRGFTWGIGWRGCRNWNVWRDNHDVGWWYKCGDWIACGRGVGL